MPIFDRAEVDFLPVILRGEGEAPPEILGALYQIDALKAYTAPWRRRRPKSIPEIPNTENNTPACMPTVSIKHGGGLVRARFGVIGANFLAGSGESINTG